MDKLRDGMDMLDLFQAQAWDDEPSGFYAKRGLSHSTVDRFNLGYTGGWGKTRALDVRRCLVIPYEDGLGNLTQLRYRPLRPDYPKDAPKYLSVPGYKAHLFAVRAADNETVYVAEGEIDAMILWQVGFRAVGIPGARLFKDAWRHLFRPPHVRRTVIVLDPDSAGMAAAKRLYDLLRDVTDVSVVSLPKGHDVNDTYLKYGPETLKEALTLG